jgi:hypothetical protein
VVLIRPLMSFTCSRFSLRGLLSMFHFIQSNAKRRLGLDNGVVESRCGPQCGAPSRFLFDTSGCRIRALSATT